MMEKSELDEFMEKFLKLSAIFFTYVSIFLILFNAINYIQAILMIAFIIILLMLPFFDEITEVVIANILKLKREKNLKPKEELKRTVVKSEEEGEIPITGEVKC